MRGVVGKGPLDMGAIRAGHSWFTRQLTEAVATSAQAAGEEAKRFVASPAVPFTHRTGGTAKATGYRVAKTRTGALIRIQNTAKHGVPLERGSKPHRIVARNARALRWFSGGGVRFAKSVWHPGTQPTWFLRMASERAGVRLGNELQGRLQRLAMDFSRKR